MSFVYDIADLYKVEHIIPLAFNLAKANPPQLEREVRMECRRHFNAARLMEKILPDIARVLDVPVAEEEQLILIRTVLTCSRRASRGRSRSAVAVWTTTLAGGNAANANTDGVECGCSDYLRRFLKVTAPIPSRSRLAGSGTCEATRKPVTQLSSPAPWTAHL